MNQVIKNTQLYHALRNRRVKKKQQREFAEWEKNGCPLPPPHLIKQRTIRSQADRFGSKVLVETGTFHGDMLEAMKDRFDHLYSIELSEELHQRAQLRFRKDNHIELIQGDSGKALGALVGRIDKPALFWLDGHYSDGITALGEKVTPIFEELEHIFKVEDQGHVIIIDDARCFGEDDGYPTIEALKEFILAKKPGAEITIQDDSIIVAPKV